MDAPAGTKRFLSLKVNHYITFLSVLGTLSFLWNIRWTMPVNPEWVVLYSMVGSILLLDHFMFRLPPENNSQSMDSALYLACLFTFGLNMTLYVLVLSAALSPFYKRLEWWKHVVNFASYSLMITSAYHVFRLSGGAVGSFQTEAVYSYVVALVSYFIVNVLALGLYYYLSVKDQFFQIIRGMFRESLAAYVSTLLLSLMLTVMFQTNFYFSLFLFLGICVLLSATFKQLFVLYQEVSDKATKDQRTGLYNHGYFEELLDKELARAKASDMTFSVAILDLDNFKKYNDSFGHLQGDKLLEFFGKLLLEECDRNEYIVARYGGEEFTVLLPQRSEREAFAFVNALRKKANDSYFEGVEILAHGCLSFSAGVAEYRKEIHDKSQLLDKADQAMYFAKAQGKNLVHIYNEQSIIQKTFDIEKDIQEIEQQLKIFLSKDIYTFQHSKRVFSYAVDFCNYVPLTDPEKKTLILGALFHDIGKLEVPRSILQKKEKLTAEEWEAVKKHVLWGKEIVSAIDKYKELLPLIELHHERVDGKGYPYGLKGEEIPKLARILCVIDSFDAMTTERPYQQTKTFDEAIRELQVCSGEQFDPVYVESFIKMIHGKYLFKLNEAAAAKEAT